ncbi:MAG: hypothetical protein WCG48_00250 [Candidatus Berkelbacteria bacterium]
MGKQTVNIGANIECFQEVGFSAFFRGTLRDSRVALLNAEKAEMDFLLVSAAKGMPAVNRARTPWVFWESTPDKKGAAPLPQIAGYKLAEISWAMNSKMNFIDTRWRKNGLVRLPASEITDQALLSRYLDCDYPNVVIDSYELMTACESKEIVFETTELLAPLLAPVFILNMRPTENHDPCFRHFHVLNRWASITSDLDERWIIVENVIESTPPGTIAEEFSRLKGWIKQVFKTE